MMSASDEQIPIKELVWLARYYHQHGFQDKAREIIRTLNEHTARNVIDMFDDEDNERRA